MSMCGEQKKEQGRDGHLYTAEDEEMPSAFYQILLRLLTEELPGSALTVRVGKLQEEGEKGVMFLKVRNTGGGFGRSCAAGLYPGLVTEPGFGSRRVSIEQRGEALGKGRAICAGAHD